MPISENQNLTLQWIWFPMFFHCFSLYILTCPSSVEGGILDPWVHFGVFGHRFSRIFNGFPWFPTFFQWVSIVFHCFQLISIGFHLISIVFHCFSMGFYCFLHDFSRFLMDFYGFLKISKGFLQDFYRISTGRWHRGWDLSMVLEWGLRVRL